MILEFLVILISVIENAIYLICFRNIGYVINQEYRQGEMLPIARARGGKCVSGSSLNEDLRLEKVLQVGLGQRLKLHLQFDKNIQSLISKGYRSHHIIIYEL